MLGRCKLAGQSPGRVRIGGQVPPGPGDSRRRGFERLGFDSARVVPIAGKNHFIEPRAAALPTCRARPCRAWWQKSPAAADTKSFRPGRAPAPRPMPRCGPRRALRSGCARRISIRAGHRTAASAATNCRFGDFPALIAATRPGWPTRRPCWPPDARPASANSRFANFERIADQSSGNPFVRGRRSRSRCRGGRYLKSKFGPELSRLGSRCSARPWPHDLARLVAQ